MISNLLTPSCAQTTQGRIVEGASVPGASPAGLLLQEQQLWAESQHLMEELLDSSRQSERLERTVKDISTLNNMMSSAVAHQAEAIEQLYSAAVESSYNISAGNDNLKQAVGVNKSSRKLIVALLVAASLGLLFFDWFNS